jgi:hypothetical protein
MSALNLHDVSQTAKHDGAGAINAGAAAFPPRSDTQIGVPSHASSMSSSQSAASLDALTERVKRHHQAIADALREFSGLEGGGFAVTELFEGEKGSLPAPSESGLDRVLKRLNDAVKTLAQKTPNALCPKITKEVYNAVIGALMWRDVQIQNYVYEHYRGTLLQQQKKIDVHAYLNTILKDMFSSASAHR